MKRFTLLIVLLVGLGLSLGFAIDVKPTVALSGYGQVTWGISLDSPNGTGFKAESDADLTITLLPKDATETKNGAEAPIYGEIKFSNVEVYWEDTAVDGTSGAKWTGGPADGDVAAKLVMKPLEIGVFKGDIGISADNVQELENDDNDDDIVDKTEADADYSIAGAGTYVAYKSDLIDIFGELLSEGDWTTNDEQAYAFGVKGTLKVKPLTLSFSGGMSMNYAAYADEKILFGAKAALDLAPTPLTAYVSADALMQPDLAFQVGAGAKFGLTADSAVYVSADMVYGPTFDMADLDPDVSGLDARIKFVEPEAGLIPALNFDVTFWLLDVLAVDAADASMMEYEAVVNLGYKVAMEGAIKYAKPFAKVTYGDPSSAAATVDQIFKAEAGVELGVSMATITVKYVSGNLMAATPVLGSILLVAKVSY